jgi:hypothetical protein
MGRPLCCHYLIVRFESVTLPVNVNGAAGLLPAHWAIGALRDGQTEVIGGWLADESGVMRWADVFDEMARRGVEQVRFVAGVDELDAKGVAPVGAARHVLRTLEAESELIGASLKRMITRQRVFADRRSAARGLCAALASAERLLWRRAPSFSPAGTGRTALGR